METLIFIIVFIAFLMLLIFIGYALVSRGYPMNKKERKEVDKDDK